MQPLPTTGVARFPKVQQFKGKDSKGTPVDLMVQEIVILGEAGDLVEVRFITEQLMVKVIELHHDAAYAFMQQGIPEPRLDPATKTVCQYRSWPIPGPYSSGDAPHPWDVVQGAKNNCRVMSGLQVLALCRPKLLMKALTCDTATGTCTIRLRRTPGPQQVAATNAPFEKFTFSTALPCVLGVNPPELVYAGAGALTKYLPLWPSFFEKALAIMWGGYGALTGAEERSLMSALGIHNVTTHHFAKDVELDNTAVVMGMQTAFAACLPMTTFIMGKQHNYGVVGADAKGVIICDPNSRPNQTYYDRWDGKPNVFNGQRATLESSANFPMFFTWDQYFDTFMWVHIFQP
ncbi:hypothetical protein ACIBHX_52170 [Nonomuraea sp. NPDC050536]|uniref:hypothetical protein n=1 Tax=Nonomuraea sp. NPDC050536 TaxID=3364366 RepID=UPI0037CA8FC3